MAVDRNRWYLLIFLMLGWAMVMLLWNMIGTMEKLAACQEHPSVETCCPNGHCSAYKPASEDK